MNGGFVACRDLGGSCEWGGLCFSRLWRVMEKGVVGEKFYAWKWMSIILFLMLVL